MPRSKNDGASQKVSDPHTPDRFSFRFPRFCCAHALRMNPSIPTTWGFGTCEVNLISPASSISSKNARSNDVRTTCFFVTTIDTNTTHNLFKDSRNLYIHNHHTRIKVTFCDRWKRDGWWVGVCAVFDVCGKWGGGFDLYSVCMFGLLTSSNQPFLFSTECNNLKLLKNIYSTHKLYIYWAPIKYIYGIY